MAPRPLPGSKNKPMSPYILEVPGRNDVVEAISKFCHLKNTDLCVLTASRTVANVTLRQSSTTLGATVTFHSHFDMLSVHLPNNVVSSNPKRVHHLPLWPTGPDRQRTHRRSFNRRQNCLHRSYLVQQPQVEFGTRDFQCKSSLLCSTFNSLYGFFPLFLIHVRTNFC